MNKTELRKWAKTIRENLPMDEISKELVQKLKKTDEYKQAKNIMIYYPLENEVNLLELLNDKSKFFYLPKINGQELLCCPYCNGDVLCESRFKTKEPLSKNVDKKNIDLIIIPALACDKNNNRLGYGGGFYDRFLKDVCATKIVCIPKELIVDIIYAENTDISIDRIITT